MALTWSIRVKIALDVARFRFLALTVAANLYICRTCSLYFFSSL
ncbi:putative receptor-like protein kinase [Iris pallida]|uniref:Receptor-like protein kinase n=1 Tax=Iris pallida TaxID=29817 RepID=A0AAX6EJG2_IRIPA|nr:putative receptor-like protein kinase [Iris pallida]